MGRSVLRRKNSRQPSVKAARNGRFTTSQVPAETRVVLSQSPVLPARMHNTSSGPRSSSGYSFAAAPRPRSTPATTGL